MKKYFFRKLKLNKIVFVCFAVFIAVLIILELKRPTILSMPFLQVFFILSLLFIQLFFLSVRMWFFARTLDKTITYWEAVKIQFYPVFINFSLPGSVGAPFKVVLLNNRTKAGMARSTVIVLFELALDIAVMCLVILLTGRHLFLEIVRFYTKYLLYIEIISAVIILAGLFLVFRFREKIENLVLGLPSVLAKNMAPLAWIILLTGLNCFLISVYYYMGLKYFYPDLSIVNTTSIVMTSILVGTLSPFPGGIGVSELFMSILGRIYNISILRIVSISLFLRTFSLFICAFFILVVFIRTIRLKKTGKKP